MDGNNNTTLIDQRETRESLLSTPLHGIYIPAGLLIVGTLIMDYTKWPYAVLLAIILGAFKVYRGNPSTIGSKSYTQAALVEKIPISSDTNIYEFELDKPSDRLGLKPGQHYKIKAKIDGVEYERNYTPLSIHDEGKFNLMIKTYKHGKVSQFMNNLQQYQPIDIKVDAATPYTKFTPNRYNQLNMIAGGTGITPMLQIIDTIVKNPNDTTKINLIYANNTIDDILLLDDLNEMQEKYPLFSLKYVLRELPSDNSINATIGMVSMEVLEKHLLLPTEASLTLVCGPPKMCEAVKPPLQKLGHEIFVF